MLTGTVWWPPRKTKFESREVTPTGDLTQFPNFGLSNFFAEDAIVWHTQAVDCQENYLPGLLAQQNAFSDKRLSDYSNIIAFELSNEPSYVRPNHLKNEPPMGSNV